MRSMSTLQVFEELPCKDADCPDVRHLHQPSKEESQADKQASAPFPG